MFDVFVDWLEQDRPLFFIKVDVLRQAFVDPAKLRSVLAR
jgi:hypothetical protein